MATKQDRRTKAYRDAKKQAEKQIAETKARINGAETWASERKEGCTDEEYALGVKCRQLREEGEPWWAIARAMELEGAGDSATTGKKGAARARTVYARAFGAHPRTFKTGRTEVEKNEHARELRAKKVSDRKREAKAGKSVISKKISDEDLAAMLKGRTIRWWIQSEFVPEGMEQEATIHEGYPLYIIGEGKSREIEFREKHKRAPIDVRWRPGPIRTVRVRQIFQVK